MLRLTRFQDVLCNLFLLLQAAISVLCGVLFIGVSNINALPPTPTTQFVLHTFIGFLLATLSAAFIQCATIKTIYKRTGRFAWMFKGYTVQ